MTYLGTAGGADSEALDLNDAGHVVGYSLSATGRTRAVIWRGGAPSEIAGEGSRATAINSAGRVVGTYTTTCPTSFSWEDGVLSPIGECDLAATDVNDRGTIILDGGFEKPNRILRGGAMDTLPSTETRGGHIYVDRLNESDWVLASYVCCSGGGGGHGTVIVVKPDGTREEMFDVGWGADLNDRGDVVGTFWEAPPSSPTMAASACPASRRGRWGGGARVLPAVGHALNTVTGEKGAVLLAPVQ